MAKLAATEGAQQVIDAALQMWGGLGVVSEQTVERLYREIRALRIYEGATEVQQLIIARELLKGAKAERVLERRARDPSLAGSRALAGGPDCRRVAGAAATLALLCAAASRRGPDGPLRSLADLAALPFTLKDDLRAAQQTARDRRAVRRQPGRAARRHRAGDLVVRHHRAAAVLRADAGDLGDVRRRHRQVWFTAGIRRGRHRGAPGGPADGRRRPAVCRRLSPHRRDAVLARRFSHRTHRARDAPAARDRDARHDVVRALPRRAVGRGRPRDRRAVVAEKGARRRRARTRASRRSARASSRAWRSTHLRETMGLGDVLPSMWGECERQDGMHFNAQRYVAVELVDPATGERLPWRDGQAASSSTPRSRATPRRWCAIARATMRWWPACAARAAAPARASAASAAPTTC